MKGDPNIYSLFTRHFYTEFHTLNDTELYNFIFLALRCALNLGDTKTSKPIL